MGKHLTNFEQSLKQAYDKYEAPYQSGSWQAMEQRLDLLGSGGSGMNAASLIAATAAAIFMIVAGTVAYFSLWNPEMNGPVARIASSGSTSSNVDLIRMADTSSGFVSADSSERIASLPSTASPAQNESSTINVSSAPTESTGEVLTNTQDQATVTNTTEVPDPSGNTSNTGTSAGSAGNTQELSFAADVRTACAGTSVEFHLTSGSLVGSYLWNFGDGTFSSKPHPVHTYSKPGVYDVTLSVTSHEDGVIRSRSIKNMIVINPVPHADFNWEFVNDAAEAPSIQFINRSEHASLASWEIAGKNVKEINPTASFTKHGEYPVKLMVTNEFGCSDSVYRYVLIEEDFKLLAPDAFSPNNDGLNDTFMPEALKIRDVAFKLTIYDNNQPIYETSDKYSPWKGVLPNGTLARPGKTFPWVVSLINEEGKEELYSGTITITP